MNKVIYAIPFPRFFSQNGGVGGHVSHAKGILDAFAQLGYQVDLFSEEKPSFKLEKNVSLSLNPARKGGVIHRILWGRQFVNTIGEYVKNKTQVDFLYIRYSVGFGNWLKPLKKKLGQIPLVLEVNSFGDHGRDVMKYFTWLEKRFMKNADLIICISDRVKDDIHEKLGPDISSKCIVVPNGVDVSRFEFISADNILSDPSNIRVGYTGLLKKDYGLETVVEGFKLASKKQPGLSLHFYGHGPLESTLKELAESNEKIEFHGVVEYERVPKILDDLDITVNAAAPRNQYQSPTKVYEYMAAERAIISASNPQVEKLLINDAGFIHSPLNAQDFAETLESIIKDPEKAKRAAKRARKQVVEGHSWKRSAEKIIKHTRDLAL